MSVATNDQLFLKANNNQEYVVGLAHSPLPRPASPPFSIVAYGKRRVIPHVIRCWGALTPRERMAGLQFRDDLGPQDGLLFMFPSSFFWPMWMLNTPIDLDIVFLSASFSESDGVATMQIVDIKQGKAFDTSNLMPSKPCNMVLEMRAGCFGFNDQSPSRGVKMLTMSGWETAILRAIRSMPTPDNEAPTANNLKPSDDLEFFGR